MIWYDFSMQLLFTPFERIKQQQQQNKNAKPSKCVYGKFARHTLVYNNPLRDIYTN